MKKRLPSFPLLLSVAFALVAITHPLLRGADQDKKLQVYLLAGQSNMDGRGDGGKLTPAEKLVLSKAGQHIRFAYNHEPIRPLDVTIPPPGVAKKFGVESTFGPEIFFGLGLSEAQPDEEFLFIKRSIGGTSLYGCWNPDWSEEKAAVMNEENSPRLYRDFADYVQEVLSAYDPDEYEIRGMLWVQGEADSGVARYGPKPAESYGDNLQNLINSIREDVGEPDLPFLMLQVGSGKVVEGMKKAAKDLPDVSFIPQSKDVDSPAYLPGYGPPVGHYNYEGMKRIGTRFAETFLETYSDQTPQAAADLSKTPNIIFLLTDDQRDDTLGAMGHPFVKTPNLDQLMSESVRFRNTYVASPVCCQSRVSIFTGLSERVHGIGFSSSYQLTEKQWEQTYPALLRKGGYYTGFVGKFGVEYYPFKGDAGDRFDFWLGHDGWTRFLPKDYRIKSTQPYHSAQSDFITPIMGEAMNTFLDTAPAEKPFCLSVSFNVPHGSQTTSMDVDYPEWRSMARPANTNPKLKGTPFYDTLYRDIAIDLPGATGSDPYGFIPEFIMDQDAGRRSKTYSYSYTKDTSREHHIRYYQTISGFDHVIGNLLSELEKRGLAENTIIIFGSDHGLLMGEYGMGGKSLLYDLSSKIPCIVHDPRPPREKRGRVADELVSSLDFPATILDYAGVEPPPQMEGRSLRPLVEGRGTEWRKELFLESLFSLRDNPFQEGLRDQRWKYIRMFDGVSDYKDSDVDFRDREPEFELLFDLDSDPTERLNLASDPAHQSTLERLRKKTAARSRNITLRREAYTKKFPSGLRE